MKQLTGTVVAVDMEATITKKDGGTYEGVEFVFRDDQGKTQTKAFHSNQFKYNQALKNTLADLNKGDKFTAEMEKEGDFWNWKKLSKGAAGATESEQTRAAAEVVKQPYQARPNDTYENKEERAARQVLIVRQSSISSAIAFCAQQKDFFKGTDDAVGEVLNVASRFEDWVLGNKAVETKAPPKEDPFEDGVE